MFLKEGKRMVKVSVIIPVYNVEKYLHECLDSVVNQTLKDIEIILIDDGSTDDSLKICEEYKNEYSNIVLFKQKNSGSGKARNLGIESAKGEFVIFLDSDDYYPENDILETLYKNAKEQGVMICGGSFSVLKGTTVETSFGKDFYGYTFEKNEIINYSDWQFDYGYHRFLYNLQFLKDNNIKFPDYRRFQDPPFFVQAMYCAKKFFALSKVTYLLRINHKYVNWKQPQQIGLLDGICDNLMFARKHNLKKLYYLTLLRLKAHSYAFCCTSLPVIIRLHEVLKCIDCSYISDIYPDVGQFKVMPSIFRFIVHWIFSLKNINGYKVLTILGLSIKFKLKKGK